MARTVLKKQTNTNATPIVRAVDPTKRRRYTKSWGGIRQWRHSNTSRVICSLLLLSVFLFFEDYFIISDSLVPNIEAGATISRNETTSTVLLPSSASTSAYTSNTTATAFPDKRDVDVDVDLGDQDEERKSSDDEDNTVQTDDAGSSSSIDPFEEQPGCSLLIQLARAGTPKRNLSMRKILKKFGKYVPVASSSSTSGEDNDHESSLHGPRYDHRSCFLMRPRYNCARNNRNATTNKSNASYVATDFAMVLETPMKTTTSTLSNRDNNTEDYDMSSSTVCDLQKFVHDAGGPAGIGRRMLQNYQKTKDIATTTDDDDDDAVIDDHGEPTEEPIVEVLLVGTSRFRQIFEALVCGFSDQMTDLRLQLGGPVFNKDHKFMNAEEIGPLVDLEFLKNGSCYLPEAQAEYSEFFRKDGTVVPSNHDRCNDNIGMVEFSIGGDDANANGTTTTTTTTTSSGGRIRFYNVFRPWAWTNVSPALEALGIAKKHKLDFVLWEPRDGADEPSWQYSSSSNLKSLYKSIFDIHTTTITTTGNETNSNNSTTAAAANNNDVSASNIEQHDAHDLYKEIQVRDTGRYFGADNPWITNPPDEEHPCMPGMPDDKVNFLLWYMLSLSAIEETNN